MRWVFVFFFAMSALFSAYSQLGQYCIEGRFSETPYFEETDILVDSNVIYGAAPRWPSQVVDTLRMDVYYPSLSADELAKRPFIMMIHGGAFLAGNRQDMRNTCRAFAQRGFVAATMTYRLGWDCDPNAGLLICLLCGNQANKLPIAVYRAVQDARAALRFVAANAQQYGVDTSAFFIGGGSAGAVTALHTTFFTQEEADAICPNCVTQIGPLDGGVNTIQANYHIRGVLNNCGAAVSLDVLNKDVPIVNFHDDLDCVVPSQYGHVLGCLNCQAFINAHGSQPIHQHLQGRETCSELNLKLLSLGHCSFPESTVVNRSACFFKRLMCGECASATNNNEWTVSPCSDLATSISSPSRGELDFRCFPNPTSGRLNIELPQPAAGKVSISVYNNLGARLLHTMESPSERYELDLHALTPGMYWVIVTTGDRMGGRKVFLMSDF